MEYVNGTNLQQYLEANGGRLSEDVARFIFQQLMIAVDFCHKNGKVNRDIKLANVLLQVGLRWLKGAAGEAPHAQSLGYGHAWQGMGSWGDRVGGELGAKVWVAMPNSQASQHRANKGNRDPTCSHNLTTAAQRHAAAPGQAL